LSETQTRTVVAIRDLQVDALIGINPDEQGRPQPLILTVELELHRGCRTSSLYDTVDYRLVAEAASRLAAGQLSLIEEFARLLGEHCLELGPVASATIEVRKPEALASGMAATVVHVSRPVGLRILPFAPPASDARDLAVRFAFRHEINADAQRMLAHLVDNLATSIEGIELGRLAFDRQTGEWVAPLALSGQRKPRVEAPAVTIQDAAGAARKEECR